MCVVSFIGDHYRDRWDSEQYRKIWPDVWPSSTPMVPRDPTVPYEPRLIPHDTITREEFNELKKEVEHMKKLLEKAVQYDRQTGQPDCHMDDKIRFLQEVAKLVGVDLSEVFNKPKQ